MSAQVTEAHRELARRIMFEFTQAGTATASDVRMAAQIIADSEAKATAEWQSFVHLQGEAIDSLLMECDRLRAELAEADADSTRERALTLANSLDEAQAELATERARLDWLLSRMGGNVLPVNGCVAWTVDVYHYKNQFPSRAAIDVAMKEETK